jgi:hypothetical protein
MIFECKTNKKKKHHWYTTIAAHEVFRKFLVSTTRVVQFVSTLRYPLRWLVRYSINNFEEKKKFISKTVTAQIRRASCSEHVVQYHAVTSCKNSTHTYHR